MKLHYFYRYYSLPVYTFTEISMKNKSIVIIPTYNEVDNIGPIIDEVWKHSPELHVLVVDDNSKDGTAEVVKQKMNGNSDKLFILEREGKLGLATAYIAGFKNALSRDYTKIVEMDADFSHDPKTLVDIIANLDTCDVVIGSRYVQGGGTENWHPLRKKISQFGSLYARMILGAPINDFTGGFNGWTSNVLNSIELDEIKSEGYSFQIELKYRAYNKKFSIREIPILFSERREGQSKMSGGIIFEALYRVLMLRFSS